MNYTKEMLETISSNYGSPCYIFDEEAFIDNYHDLEDTLKTEYSKYKIAYSYKTNYAPKICSLVREMGGYAEVVSDMEYDIALKVGYDAAHIIYNGPFKGDHLEDHLLGGGILNIDNIEEVERVIRFAALHPNRTFSVGFRVNIDIGQNFISRFGIDADSDDLSKAATMIAQSENVLLTGLHCHIGQSRGLEAWKKRTEIILELADRYVPGIPRYLDLGSGMFGQLAPDMAKQFTCHIPTYQEYAEVTSKLVNEHYSDVEDSLRPILFTEPGTTLDNRYIDLLATVDSIKRIKNVDMAVLDCSVHNLGDVSGSVQLPIQVIHNSNENMKSYTNMNWVGYTCLERDVPYKRYTGDLAKGDYVVFGNVGGYSNVDKPPFILPQCAMIGINNRETYVIKRKETVDDILSTYLL